MFRSRHHLSASAPASEPRAGRRVVRPQGFRAFVPKPLPRIPRSNSLANGGRCHGGRVEPSDALDGPANTPVAGLLEAEIIEEHAGRRRNWVFAYGPSLRTFAEGAEVVG